MSSDKNDRKWVQEIVLQRYIKENPQKWKIHGKKVLAINYNDPFNAYPDLLFTVEGEPNSIPVEVEWRSSDFNHDAKVLIERNGMVFCLKKDQEDEIIGVKQFEIPRNGFQVWLKSNAINLLKDSLSNFDESVTRNTPKLWIKYISKRGGDLDDYKKYGHRHTAGIQTKHKAVKKFKQVQKDDLIMFVIEGIQFNARGPPEKWHLSSFRGTFKKIEVFRVTKGYYDSRKEGEGEIWGRSEDGDIYPHRFKFDELENNGKTPLLKLKNLKVSKLSYIAIEQLRKVASANFIEGDYATLVECIYHSQQAI